MDSSSTQNQLTNQQINPLLPSVPYMARLAKILIFNLRRDHKKNSYERRDYESVDEKMLSLALSRKLKKN